MAEGQPGEGPHRREGEYNAASQSQATLKNRGRRDKGHLPPLPFRTGRKSRSVSRSAGRLPPPPLPAAYEGHA